MNIEKKALSAIEKGLFTSWNIPLQNYTQNEHELFNSHILIRCRVDVSVKYDRDYKGRYVDDFEVSISVSELYFSETGKNMISELSHKARVRIDESVEKIVFDKMNSSGDWISEDKIHWND